MLRKAMTASTVIQRDSAKIPAPITTSSQFSFTRNTISFSSIAQLVTTSIARQGRPETGGTGKLGRGVQAVHSEAQADHAEVALWQAQDGRRVGGVGEGELDPHSRQRVQDLAEAVDLPAGVLRI